MICRRVRHPATTPLPTRQTNPLPTRQTTLLPTRRGRQYTKSASCQLNRRVRTPNGTKLLYTVPCASNQISLHCYNNNPLEVPLNRWYLFHLLLAALICLPIPSLAQPDIIVSRDSIEFQYPRRFENIDLSFTITNDGDEDLVWRARMEIISEPERQGPRRDDAGDLIARFGGGNAADQHCSPVGWDWDNEIIWMAYAERGFVIGYSHDGWYENFEQVRRLNVGARFDGAWAKGLLYLAPFNSIIIQRFNARGQNVGSNEMPFPIVGLAADNENDWLFAMSAEDRAIHVFVLNDGGDVEDEIGVIDNHLEYHNNSVSYGLEWVPKHTEGKLWMIAPNTGRVHQIAVDTDNWQCTEEVQSFVAFPGGEESLYSSVCHDGHNLWAGGFFEDDVRIYDDGVTELYWMIFEPRSGTLASRQDEDVWLTFVRSELIEGVYEADIIIESNDPDEPVVIFNVRMIFGGPDIAIEWSEEAGFRDVMDFNMRFGDVFVGTSYSLPFRISNEGNEDLEINEIFTEGEPFWVAEEAFVLRPDEDREMELIFRTEQADVWESTLTIISNDPVMEEFTVLCHAEAHNPPVMNVDTEMIELSPDSTEILYEIVIGNDGESELRWQAEIVSVDTLVFDDPDETEILIEPSRGVIQSAESQVVVLTFRLIEFERNDEAFDLHIRSNEPDNPDFIVHIIIHWPVAVAGEGTLPTTTALLSLYPNPFNNSTTISFAVGAHRDAPLRLVIYGMDGRLVGDLLTGRNAYPPGFHSVVWNADGFPAGSYLVRLEAGSGVVQEKWLRLVK